ncbi:VC1465 family Xer recombination activation factor [Xylophilus ampelinus]
MYRGLGLDRAGVAKLLQVSPRTLHNWESGRHPIPHMAYRLLRLHFRVELPGDGWVGWSFVAGKLRSPEGHTFVGSDCSWWSLFIRQARFFGPLYRENMELRRVLGAKGRHVPGPVRGTSAGRAAEPSPAAVAAGRREAPALDLSLRHFGTQTVGNPTSMRVSGLLVPATNRPERKIHETRSYS